jgi:nickel-dependent lactate racemase
MGKLVEIKIPYGTGLMKASIPAINYQETAVPVEPLQPVEDDMEEIKRALLHPFGSPTLSQLVKPSDKIAIIVSDYTRPTPTGRILDPVLTELHDKGIRAEHITIIIACGLHEPSPLSSLKIMLGQDILDRYKVVNHNADDSDNLVLVGYTSLDIPVRINKIVKEADIKISIGSIDPHRFAGWSGGAKNILPGVAARETVNAHHILLQNPAVGLGKTKGNPFRDQLEEAARLAKLDFIINVVLTATKKIAFIVAGDLVAAHRAGVDFAHRRMRVRVKQQADVVIASPGGAPRDGEFWQTEGKCLGPVADVVKDGGIVIAVAQCLKGVGNDEFAQYLRSMDYQEMKAALEKGPFSMALAKAYKFAKLAEKSSIYLITEGVTNAAFPKIPVTIFTTLEKAVHQILKRNPDASILIVPDASGVVMNIAD